jgi:adsorption protein B
MDLHFLDAGAQVTAYGVAIGIFINVADDAFVDARYFFGRLGAKGHRVIDREVLMATPPKRIAIMLPAWQEAEVIEHMISRNLERLNYPRDRMDFFCGTYQNDPQTQARVDNLTRRNKNVHKVIVPHDGPTSKADCLNWIYQGVVLLERERGERFEILLMHDAEDVIHDLALRLYSFLIPERKLVQTPVFSLPLPLSRLVAATYIDEFAEHHQKDMRVREAIGGMVPSAGVGTAFDRDTFEEIAIAAGQQPFNVDSLTEDYEIGLKFRLSGRCAHFAFCSVKNPDGTQEVIATREYFPSGFRASVRQRSRWILGITLQTWEQLGWPGGLPVLYCLWRDRKAILTNVLLLFAYALLFYFLVRFTGSEVGTGAWSMNDVVPPHSALAWVLGFNFAFAGWRMCLKAFFVGRLYGYGHAALSIPRICLANVIGICATSRAAWQYARHRWSGKPLRWLKTAHEFPDADRLAVQQGLAEYLLAQNTITAEDMDEALSLQRATGTAIEDVLMAAGIVSEAAVAEAVASEHHLSSIIPDALTIDRALLQRLSEDAAEELDVLPLSAGEGKIVVATAQPLEAVAEQQLARIFGGTIEQRIAPREALHGARARAYRRLVSQAPPPPPSDPIASLAVDRKALARLGVGFCAFHGVVPVRHTGPEPHVLASTPLHPNVLAMMKTRLGRAPVVETTTAYAALRIAIASVEGSLPTAALEEGLFGLDAVECHALRDEISGDIASFAREARSQGLSPLEWLEKIRADDPAAIARVRARTFGLPLAKSGAAPAAGLLPLHLATEHDVTVLAQGDDLVSLSAPRPTPRLAQEVASLLSPMKIAWSITTEELNHDVDGIHSTRLESPPKSDDRRAECDAPRAPSHFPRSERLERLPRE